MIQPHVFSCRILVLSFLMMAGAGFCAVSSNGLAQQTQEQKPLNLENISKKMSLWPKEVKAIKNIKYRQDGVEKIISAGDALPVVSIRPEGIEVEHKGARMVLPQQAVDLRTPIMERIKEIALEAERERRAHLARQQSQGNAGQNQAAQGNNQAQAPAQKRPSNRPQPRVQTSEPTDFIRALNQDLIITGNNRLREYSSLTFKDKHYYLIFMGAGWNEGTKELAQLLEGFYKGAQRYNKNWEIVYVSFDRQEKDARDFLMEARMPWPAVDPGEVRKHRELVPLEAPGIPALALVDRQGNVISHSHGPDRKTYRGPAEVMADLGSVLDLPKMRISDL